VDQRGGAAALVPRQTRLGDRRGEGRSARGGDDKRQLIELDFEETDGITTVRFTHSGLWDEESVRSHEDGWGKCFDNLERTLQAAQPGR
jgi:hypothetical protein